MQFKCIIMFFCSFFDVKLFNYRFQSNSCGNMNLLFPVVIFLLFDFINPSKTGKCSKFLPNTESCQQCEPHHHLFNDSCYVDIHGCREYVLGNICSVCSQNHILLNNKCCDHDCISKYIQKNHSPSIKHPHLTTFEMLKMIILYIETNYLKQAIQNLSQIQSYEHVDVFRFIFLFIQSKIMKRAIVDITKDNNQIIMIDWSEIKAKKYLLQFEKKQVPQQQQQKLQNIINQIFPKRQPISFIKIITFSEISQFQFAVIEKENDRIVLKIIYLWKGSIFTLISTQKNPINFHPAKIILNNQTQIISYDNKNPYFSSILNKIQNNSKNKGEIIQITINNISKYLSEYQIEVKLERQIQTYFILENLKNQQIIIFNSQKSQNKEIYSISKSKNDDQNFMTRDNDLTINNSDKWKNLKIKTIAKCMHKIKEQIKQLSNNIKKIQFHGLMTDQPILQFLEALKYSIKNKKNLKIWKNTQFKTFTEWTFAYQEEDNLTFLYINENKNRNSFDFIGKTVENKANTEFQESQKEKMIKLNNPQKIICACQRLNIQEAIRRQIPRIKNYTILKATVRIFPHHQKRYKIIIQQNDFSAKIVLLKKQNNPLILKQWKILKSNLPPLTEYNSSHIKLFYKIKEIFSSMLQGKQINYCKNSNHETQLIFPVLKNQNQKAEYIINLAISFKQISQILKNNKQYKSMKEQQQLKSIIKYRRQTKPQIKHSKLKSLNIKRFKNFSIFTMIIEDKKMIHTLVFKKENSKISEIFYDYEYKAQKQTLNKIIKQIEDKISLDFKSIDPQQIYYTKALKILKKQNLGNFQKQINLKKQDTVIHEAVAAIREHYVMVRNSNIIKIIQNIDTTKDKVFIIYFYVKKNYQFSSFRVYTFTVKCFFKPFNTFKILQVVLLVKNGELTNQILQKIDYEEHINLAYGFESVNLIKAKKDKTIQLILKQLNMKYKKIICNQQLREIEELDLKNGKANYVIKFDNVYFTIFYDKNLMRVLLLNQVQKNGNQNKYSFSELKNFKNINLHKRALTELVKNHLQQLQNYKIIGEGEMTNKTHYIIQVEFLAKGQKYRGKIAISINGSQVKEISWTQILQVDLQKINYLAITQNVFQRLRQEDLRSNQYFKMVNSFIRNQNTKILQNSKIIGVLKKGENFGFIFKIFYMITSNNNNHTLCCIQTYIESISQQIKQLSLTCEDFQTNFVTVIPKEGYSSEIKQILSIFENKISVSLKSVKYFIKIFQVKNFLFGNLYHIIIQIDGIFYEAFLYHDHQEQKSNLYLWHQLSSSKICLVWIIEEVSCLKCSKGYFLPKNSIKCQKQIVGCIKYSKYQRLCQNCGVEYFLINGICVKNCGVLCKSIDL